MYLPNHLPIRPHPPLTQPGCGANRTRARPKGTRACMDNLDPWHADTPPPATRAPGGRRHLCTALLGSSVLPLLKNPPVGTGDGPSPVDDSRKRVRGTLPLELVGLLIHDSFREAVEDSPSLCVLTVPAPDDH